MKTYQPCLQTPPHLLPILALLKPLEPLIYAANNGKTRDYFESLLAPEFWEIAASGKRYSRAYVLSALADRQQNPFEQAWHTSAHYLQAIADDLYLLSYTLHQPSRISERSSLWRQSEGKWQLIYHQGTAVT